MKLFGKRKPPAGSSSTGVNLERKSGGPKLDRGSVSFSDKGDSDPSGAPRGNYRLPVTTLSAPMLVYSAYQPHLHPSPGPIHSLITVATERFGEKGGVPTC